MTVKLITTSTRPSKDISWSDDPSVPFKFWYMLDPYFMETWNEKGKLLSTTITHSEDELSFVLTREFINWEALDEFISDANLSSIRTIRNEYTSSVGIEITNMETVEV